MSVDGLPLPVAADLLDRWSEPHRRYHSTTHLVMGLQALAVLGAGGLERIAFWFHDARHLNTSPDDEIASAALAGVMLTGVVPPDQVREVQRLVLLTTRHQPRAGDDAGARLCDADLAGLAAPWDLYRENTSGIRHEMPWITDEQFRVGRAAFMTRFLERPRIYHTDVGFQRWESNARRNIRREIDELRAAGH